MLKKELVIRREIGRQRQVEELLSNDTPVNPEQLRQLSSMLAEPAPPV